MNASLPRKITCWAIHLYTALGLVAAFGVAVLIIRGGPVYLAWAFVLLGIALFIDGTDGTLARAVNIKKVLPGFDGRRLDDIIDFLNYTFLPLMIIYRAALLPHDWEWTLVFAGVASAYGFCQVKAKTDDGYFRGFPSYWNLVALYLFLLPVPGWLAVSLVLSLALLTFVPTRYLYPSQGGKLNMVTNVLSIVWGVMIIWIMVKTLGGGKEQVAGWTLASLFFPIFYLVASWAVEVKVWLTPDGKRAATGQRETTASQEASH